MSKPPATPELEKMKAVRDQSQKIGEFLDWLSQRRIRLCEETDPPLSYDAPYMPIRDNTEQLLADYFHIDLRKCEEERRALLDHIREGNKKK